MHSLAQSYALVPPKWVHPNFKASFSSDPRWHLLSIQMDEVKLDDQTAKVHAAGSEPMLVLLFPLLHRVLLVLLAFPRGLALQERESL